MDVLAKTGATPLYNSAGQQLGQAVVANLPSSVAGQGLLPAPAPLQVATGDVSAIGAVALMPSQAANQNLGNAITFTMDNSAGLTATVFYMFNAYGMLSSIAGVSATRATYVSSGQTDAFQEESKVTPYTFTGFNVQATVSAASLANQLKFYELSSSGAVNIVPNNLGTALRNTAQTLTLQTFQIAGGYTASANRAVTFSVPAGETITFTWFVGGQSNRLF